MSDIVTTAVKQANEVYLTRNEVWGIAISFIFGGFTSAVWTWKEAKRELKWSEIVSTGLASGLFAMVWGCILMRYSMPNILLIAVSILCGFSGDIVIRGIAKLTPKLLEVIFSKGILNAFGISTSKTERLKDDDKE